MDPKHRSFLQRAAFACLLLVAAYYLFVPAAPPSVPATQRAAMQAASSTATPGSQAASPASADTGSLVSPQQLPPYLQGLQAPTAGTKPLSGPFPLTSQGLISAVPTSLAAPDPEADAPGLAEGVGPLPNPYTNFRLPMSYTEFLKRADAGQFRTASYLADTRTVLASSTEGTTLYTTQLPPNDTTTLPMLVQKGVDVTVVPPSPGSPLSGWVMMLGPTLLFIGFLYWSQQRQMKGMGGGLSGFGKSKAQRTEPGQNRTRFTDVAGCDEAKAEVAELVTFLKDPDLYFRVGAKSPKGVLMQGPPGTGKTLLAKAVAGEAGVPFFSTSGSEFVEMFVGVGAGRVRSMFEEARRNAPCILFIDEIDAIGKARSGGAAGGGGGHDEREQTLNQLLVEMDGFQSTAGVVVIAATNRAEMLDEALRRPGRFDRSVFVNLPDVKGRANILAVHGKRVPVSSDVDWTVLARGTPGFSGAELSNLINEAAMMAAREKAALITHAHLERARDRLMMGAERKGAMVNPREREVVAYHEAGHAIVAHFQKLADPVHKITIVPRGQALGLTMQLPPEDAGYNHDRERLVTDISVLMGGRAAEEVALNTMTVGASDDFNRATQLARRMVAYWGMSDLGPVVVDTSVRMDGPQWSEHWKMQVDDRVAQLTRERYAVAKQILVEHREALETVAKALLEHETLDAGQFEALVGAPVGHSGVTDDPRTPTYEEVLGEVLPPAAS